MILSLLLSSFLNSANAVPLQITHQGRLLDANGAAMTGTHDLTFRIYDSTSGGSMYWSETLVVSFNNGYYATVLGTDEQNNALDSSVLSLYPLYLELQVDSNSPMTSRQAINSAPYAQMAGNAEIAESVDGGSVNATEVSINASQVIDGNGNWVGQPITVDWNNIDPNTIPAYIADGDDNTQLSEGQVEGYITNDAIDLAVNSQMNGSDIVTAGTFNSYLPTDIADGDSDTLAGLSCSAGEIAGWDGNTWVCVSDSNLTLQDITTMLANNQMDLNAATSIGGATIVTTTTDSDTLAALGCSDGEVAKYNTNAGVWECATDIDTVLSEQEVENYITNGSLDLTLGSNTTIGGNTVITTGSTLTPDWNDITSRPPGLDDGDDDVLGNLACSAGELAGWDGNTWVCVSDNTLTLSDITTMLANNAVDLNSGTTIGGAAILTTVTDSDTLAALGCADGEVAKYNSANGAWACGADIDTDTTLDEATVETYVTNGGLDLNVTTTIGGLDIVTSIDDSDTLANLSCANDGEIARYDLVLDEWYCDVDMDTVLDEGTVETYVTNGAIDLNAGTTIGGSAILTTITDSDTLAALGCSDGQVAKYNTISSSWSCAADIDTDTDTQLSESQVETYVTNGAIDLNAGTTIGGNSILTSADTLTPDWNNLTSIPSDIDDGDDDTLANLGCSDGEALSYSTSSGAWVCTSSSSGASVEVGTYVGDGNASQIITTSNEFSKFEIFSDDIGVYVSGNTQTSFEFKETFMPTNLYGNGSDGIFAINLTVSLTGTEFNYTSFNLMNSGHLTLDSGIDNSPTSIRSQGDIVIDGSITVVPRGSTETGAGGSGSCGDIVATRGRNADGITEILTSSQLSSVNGGVGTAGGPSGVSYNAGAYGGGGLLLISPTKISIGSGSTISVSGADATYYGGGCPYSNGAGSGGLLQLVAPIIEINGEIVAESGWYPYHNRTEDNGALVLIGYADYTSAVSLPSTTMQFQSFSEYMSSKVSVDLVAPITNSLEVESVLNLSGKTYTYIVQ